MEKYTGSDKNELIIPTEFKVCATCSYWTGQRRFDEEIGVVVVSQDCRGECLAREQQSFFDGLFAASLVPGLAIDCEWETMHGDQVDEVELNALLGAEQ